MYVELVYKTDYEISGNTIKFVTTSPNYKNMNALTFTEPYNMSTIDPYITYTGNPCGLNKRLVYSNTKKKFVCDIPDQTFDQNTCKTINNRMNCDGDMYQLVILLENRTRWKMTLKSYNPKGEDICKTQTKSPDKGTIDPYSNIQWSRSVGDMEPGDFPDITFEYTFDDIKDNNSKPIEFFIHARANLESFSHNSTSPYAYYTYSGSNRIKCIGISDNNYVDFTTATNTSFDKDKDYSHTYIRIVFYEQNKYPTQPLKVLPYTDKCNNSCWASSDTDSYTCKHYDTLTKDKC